MPYRDETEALSAQQAILEADLARARERATQLREATTEVQRIERQLAAVIKRAGAIAPPRKTSPLDNIKIASPCKTSWDAMTGDDRVRHCGLCKKDVFNITAMTRAEAEALLVERNGSLCLRLFRRKDGTVLTADCPDGVVRRNRRRVVLTVLSTVAIAAVGAFAHGSQTHATESQKAPDVSRFQPLRPHQPDLGPVDGASRKPPVPQGYTVEAVPCAPKVDPSHAVEMLGGEG